MWKTKFLQNSSTHTLVFIEAKLCWEQLSKEYIRSTEILKFGDA